MTSTNIEQLAEEVAALQTRIADYIRLAATEQDQSFDIALRLANATGKLRAIENFAKVMRASTNEKVREYGDDLAKLLEEYPPTFPEASKRTDEIIPVEWIQQATTEPDPEAANNAWGVGVYIGDDNTF